MVKFQSIQSLRFFAAMLVLGYHLDLRLANMGEHYHTSYPHLATFGRLGVDIFFVISGFIMTCLVARKFGEPGAGWRFVSDRITRIVPLYWIFTTVSLVWMMLALHYAVNPAQVNVPTLQQVAESYFFIPYLNATGKHFPVLGQGWTLDYEMLFYVIISACLFFKRGLILVFGLFGAVFLAGRILGAPQVLQIYSNPIIFEFLAGVVLGLIRLRFGVLIPLRAQPLILLLPIVALTVLGDGPQDPWHILNFPVAFVLVGFGVLGRDQGTDTFSRALATMGDWSYSLYLLHEFVLMAVGSLWHRLFGGHALHVLAVVMIGIAIALSWVSFTYLERPLTRYLRGKPLRGAVPATS